MRRILVRLSVLGFIAAHAGELACAQKDGAVKQPEKKHKPRFSIGKDTTYVIGPLDADGYIDYAEALNERLSKGVAPENNANVLLWKAFGPNLDGKEKPLEFFKRLGMSPPPAKGDYFIDLRQYLKEHAKLEPGDATDKVLREVEHFERPWTAQQHPHFAGWLKAIAKPLAVVSAASRRPRFFSPWSYVTPKIGPPGLWDTTTPHAYWACAQALTVRATLALGEKRDEDAWRDLLASHRLGRLTGHFGTSQALLVACAIEAITHKAELAYLAHANPNAQRLRECQRDLQELPARVALADTIDLGERLVFLDFMCQLERHGIGHLLRVFSAEASKTPDALAKHPIDWDTALRTANHWRNRLAAATRINDRRMRSKLLDQIQEELQPLKKYWNDGLLLKPLLGPAKTSGDRGKLIADFWLSVVVSSQERYMNASDRAEQNYRNLTLAVALAGYRRGHGRYPRELKMLAADYLPEIPHDLFNARPLTYRPSDDGYLLYSLGVNGKDDGGRTYGEEPYGSDDLVVRMPLRTQR